VAVAREVDQERVLFALPVFRDECANGLVELGARRIESRRNRKALFAQRGGDFIHILSDAWRFRPAVCVIAGEVPPQKITL
jgi:hypothetical protein